MNRKVIAGFVFIFFFIGVLGFFRFSSEARTVDAVGLFASGMTCGAALVGLIVTLKRKSATV